MSAAMKKLLTADSAAHALFALFALLLAAAACGASKEGTTENPPPIFCVRSTYVSPPNATLPLGASLRLTAIGLGECGVPASPTVLWRSANASVASVETETGVVHAVGQGVTTITALLANDTTVRAAAVITVEPAVPSVFAITSVSYVSNGKAANLDSLAGVIQVEAVAPIYTTGSLTAELVTGNDSVVATSTTPPPVPPVSTHILQWNTDARNAAGSRIFPNGAVHFRVRFRQSASSTVVNTVLMQGTLRNP